MRLFIDLTLIGVLCYAVSQEPKVFIGQAPVEATQEDVFKLFSQYGNIKVNTTHERISAAASPKPTIFPPTHPLVSPRTAS